MSRPEDERAPLLGVNRPTIVAEPVPMPTAAASSRFGSLRLTDRQKAIIVTFVSIFLVEIAVNSSGPAVNNMMETILCREQYGELSGAEGGDPRCKTPDVQRRLSYLRGWSVTFQCMPPILLSIPYGILADKIGRRPVLLLGYLGITLETAWSLFVLYFSNFLPLWAVWFGPLFSCIGNFEGNGPALIYTCMADVTPQAGRANVYFRLNAIFLLAELISNPLGGALLLVGNWTPLLFGFVTMVLAGLVILLLPETLNFDQDSGRVASPGERTATATNGPVVVTIDGDTDTASVDEAMLVEAQGSTKADDDSGGRGSVWRQVVHLLRTDAAETSTFIIKNRQIMVIMCSLVFFVLGKFVQELLLQYATKRYGWSWSTAAFLLTIRSTTTLLLFLIILPAVSTFVVRRLRISPLIKDLWMARASGAILIVGALLIAFAVTPIILSFALVVFSLGSGFSPVMRSLLNAFVEPHHQAMLMSIVSLLEFLGLMVAAPVLFGTLQKGIELGGLWLGLPFLVAAGMFVVGSTIVFLFRLPPPETPAAVDFAQNAGEEAGVDSSQDTLA